MSSGDSSPNDYFLNNTASDSLVDNEDSFNQHFLTTKFDAILMGVTQGEFIYRDFGNRSTPNITLATGFKYETALPGQWLPVTGDYGKDEFLVPFTCIRKTPECPEDYAFAYYNGTRCCSNGNGVILSGAICNGEYINCTSTLCNTAVNKNKCETGFHRCDDNATCEPLINGKYRCWCQKGYYNQAYTYQGDYLEGSYPTCKDTDTCSLLEYGDGFDCSDIDECSSKEKNQCDDGKSICTNSEGSYSCECKTDFTDKSADGEKPEIAGSDCKCEKEGYSLDSINEEFECIRTVYRQLRRIYFFHFTTRLPEDVKLANAETHYKYTIQQIEKKVSYKIIEIRDFDGPGGNRKRRNLAKNMENDQSIADADYLVIGEIIFFTKESGPAATEALDQQAADILSDIKEVGGLFTKCPRCSFDNLSADEDEKNFKYWLQQTKTEFPIEDPIPPTRLEDCTNNQSACNLYYPMGEVEGFKIVLIPNIVLCIVFNAFALYKIQTRYQSKLTIPTRLEDFGFLAKIQNSKVRVFLYKLFKFLPSAFIVIIDAVDVIFDTVYFHELASPGGPDGGGVINQYLQIPYEAFLVMFVCLVLTIGLDI